MKSRTSFFNATVLKKDITRFMPVWIIYTVILLLRLPELHGDLYVRVIRMRSDLFSSSVINMIYAAVVAAMVFGDLYKTRLCYSQHAMPLRREGWFLTHCAAGLLFSLVPNLLYSILSAFLLQKYYYFALLWLAVNVLQYLFFFGLAVFCAMCAGSRLGMAGIYSLCNFFVQLMWAFVQGIFISLLHGVKWDPAWRKYLSPYVVMSDYYVDIRTIVGKSEVILEGPVTETWVYTAIAAVIGVALGICAMLLYRKRNLERAGDFLALPKLRPVFWIIAAVGMETLLFSITTVPLVGMILGFFAAKMLLERTVKVFRWKHIRWGLLMVGVYIACILVTAWDPLGVHLYVPEVSDVKSLNFNQVSFNDGKEDYLITDPAQLEEYLQLHAKLTEYETMETRSYCVDLEFMYELNNGQKIIRKYLVDVDGQLAKETAKILSHWQYVFGTDDWESLLDTQYIMIGREYIPNEKVEEFLEAVRKDCEAGTMCQYSSFREDKNDVRGVAKLPDQTGRYVISIEIYNDCTHTCQYLDSLLDDVKNG